MFLKSVIFQSDKFTILIMKLLNKKPGSKSDCSEKAAKLLQSLAPQDSEFTIQECDSSNNADILVKRSFKPVEFVIEHLIQITAFISLAFIILIFVFVFREASSIFNQKAVQTSGIVEVSETYGEEMLGENDQSTITKQSLNETQESKQSFWDLLGSIWQPVSLQPKFGIWPLFIGSIKVALISLLFSAPIAILAALYTTMFAPNYIKETVKPVIEILAGFPSVVIGFFAILIIASLLQNIFGYQYRLNAFVGGLALSIAIIPVIFTISEDALKAVPKSYIEASLALGAEKWETALFVVLPAALPGVFAAILLGIGRAIGETMIVIMATGNAAFSTLNPFDPARTMSATIGAEMAEVVFGDFHYGVLFFIGVILFAISFLINFTAEIFVRQLVMRRFK